MGARGTRPSDTLNCPRMFPFAHGRERIVETHRDVANEQTSSIGDFETSRRAFHEAVGFEWRERGEFAGEVLREVDAELL